MAPKPLTPGVWTGMKSWTQRVQRLSWENSFGALRTGTPISLGAYLGKTAPIVSSVYNKPLVITWLRQKWATRKFLSHKKDINRKVRQSAAAGQEAYWEHERCFVTRKKVTDMNISRLALTEDFIFVLIICGGRKVKWETPLIFSLALTALYQTKR